MTPKRPGAGSQESSGAIVEKLIFEIGLNFYQRKIDLRKTKNKKKTKTTQSVHCACCRSTRPATTD